MNVRKFSLTLFLSGALVSTAVWAGKHDHDHGKHDHDTHKHEKHDHDAHKHHEHEHEKREHGAHVHGVAQLQIAIEKNAVEVELESPSMNVIGFEHAPKNKAQKQKVEKAVVELGDYKNVLELTEGGCELKKANIESPFKSEHKEHAHKGHDHKHDDHGHKEHGKEHKDEDTHSDFRMSYHLECKTADKIKTVELTVFKHFPGFEKLNVEWVGAKGQGAQVATKEKPVVTLK